MHERGDNNIKNVLHFEVSDEHTRNMVVRLFNMKSASAHQDKATEAFSCSLRLAWLEVACVQKSLAWSKKWSNSEER